MTIDTKKHHPSAAQSSVRACAAMTL